MVSVEGLRTKPRALKPLPEQTVEQKFAKALHIIGISRYAIALRGILYVPVMDQQGSLWADRQNDGTLTLYGPTAVTVSELVFALHTIVTALLAPEAGKNWDRDGYSLLAFRFQQRNFLQSETAEPQMQEIADLDIADRHRESWMQLCPSRGVEGLRFALRDDALHSEIGVMDDDVG